MRKRERGAAAVEMALVLPILVLLIGGIIDFGRAYFTQVVLTNAAREGTRYALTVEDVSTASAASNIESRAEQAAAVINTGSVVANATFYDNCASTSYMTVEVDFDFDFFFLTLLPGVSNPWPLTGTSEFGCK